MHRTTLAIAAACLMAMGPSIAFAADAGGGGGSKAADKEKGAAPEQPQAPAITQADVEAAVSAAVAESEKQAGLARAALEEAHEAEIKRAEEAVAVADKRAVDALAEAKRLAEVLAEREAEDEARRNEPADLAAFVPVGLAKVRHPDGATSATVGGHVYEADDTGELTVPLEAINALKDHGFQLVQ